MFITASLRHYRIEEYIQFMHDVKHLCINNDVTLLQLGQRFQNFSEQLDLLEAAYAKPQRHALTQVIQQLDEQRDSLFSQINYYLNGNLLDASPQVSESAAVLLQKINDYGGVAQINRLNYQAQTAALRNLVDDMLEMPEVDQLMTVTEYRTKLETLRNINEEFRLKFIERTQDQGTLSSEEAFFELRKPMNEAYNKLLFRIEASAEFNEDAAAPIPNFQRVAEGINDVIKRLNSLVQSRKTSESSENETELPTEESE